MKLFIWGAVLAAGVLFYHMPSGHAQVPADALANVSNWVPNVGVTNLGELPLGDMWTILCPAGATVFVSVDTKDDLDTVESCLDPVLEAYDATGALVDFGDDNFTCTYPPVCGFACPSVQFECGGSVGGGGGRGGGTLSTRGGAQVFSLIVRDFGAAFITDTCNKGGGYELSAWAVDADGNFIPASQLHLNGGPSRGVPAWAVADGAAATGPALDDENVPSIFFVVAAGANTPERQLSK